MNADERGKVWHAAEAIASAHRGARPDRGQSGAIEEGALLGAQSPRRRPLLASPDRGRQVSRVLESLRALETEPLGVTIADLIQRPHLSFPQRTLQSDLEHLQAAGFPINRQGDRYSLCKAGSQNLLPSQVLSLLLAEELLAPLHGSAIQRDLVALRESFRRRLTAEGRVWIERLRETMVMTLRAGHLPTPPESLDAIQDALVLQRCLHLEYTVPETPAETLVIEPHFLSDHQGALSLVAYCYEDQQFRQLSFDHIRSACLLDQAFEQRLSSTNSPEPQTPSGVFQRREAEALIRVTRDTPSLAQEVAPKHVRFSSIQPDGRVEMAVHAPNLSEMAAWIAASGGQVEAVAPPELRARVFALHEAGLRAHTDPDSNR